MCTPVRIQELSERAGSLIVDEDGLREAIPSLRHVAFRFKSEWSVTSPDELSDEIVTGWPPERTPVNIAISRNHWEVHVAPLAFHAEMRANSAPVAIVGPYLDDPLVWHIHPLFFMAWMNQRVRRHQEILRSLDRPHLGRPRSTIRIEQGFVVGFMNPPVLPRRRPGVVYAEACHGDNTYEITVDRLADQTALQAQPQTTTRFRTVLLEALDFINDGINGIDIVEGYAANAASEFADQHRAGRAADIRPGNPRDVSAWYDLFQKIQQTATYMEGAHGDGALRVVIVQGPGPGRSQAGPSASSREFFSRLQTARRRNDPLLSAPGQGDAASLLADLPQLRFHLETDA